MKFFLFIMCILNVFTAFCALITTLKDRDFNLFTEDGFNNVSIGEILITLILGLGASSGYLLGKLLQYRPFYKEN